MLNNNFLAILIASALGLTACGVADETTQTIEVNLRIMETSDIHANIMDFNYYTGQIDKTIGLARTAALIHQARAEASNSVLVDNGDLLQGSPMGDSIAHEFESKNQLTDTHPAYKAMNTLN